MIRRFLLPVFLLFLPLSLWAQYDPQFEWKLINTENHQIIFPAPWEKEALKAALLAEKYHSLLREDLKIAYPFKYPVILTMNDRLANGYVSTFPRRSVWYSFPSLSGMGTALWYETLAIHEGRHMAQFEKLDSHTAHLLFLLGGELWSSLAVGVTPSWVLEGDGVIMETELTHSGRGRSGAFLEGMKAVAVEEGYSYHKMLNLSYKDYIPDPYSFGYEMMKYLKLQYGDSYLDSILDETAWLPLPLWGYSRGIKKLTGLPPGRVYEDMRENLSRETREEIIKKGELILGELFSPAQEIYTRYSHLSTGEEGQLYAIKSNLNHSSKLYRLTRGGEEALFDLDPFSSYSWADNKHVWDELKVNRRYPTRQSMEIRIRGESYRNLNFADLYSPVLSPLGEKLAALGYTAERGYYLQLSHTMGDSLVSYDFPQGISMAAQLSWAGENSLLMVVQNEQGKSLWSFSETAGFQSLIPFTTEDPGHPVSGMGGVFFTLDRESGREICFLKGGVIYQITNTPYGVDYPAVDKSRLYFVNVSGSLGHEIRYLDQKDMKENREITLAPPLLPLPESPSADYVVEDYRAHSFFHPVGWGFATGYTPNPADLEIPFTLISYNEMRTVLWEGGVYYNINENTLNYRLYGQFSPFFPVITTLIELNERVRSQTRINDFMGSGGILIPFGFSRGRDQRGLDLQSRLIYQYSWTDFNRADQISLLGSMNVYHTRSGGYRSLQPQWEESLSLSVRYSPEDSSLIHLHGQLHLLTPAILPSHGMGFYAYYEKNNSLYISAVPQVRGYTYEPQVEQILFKAEYVLPLFYPDLALGGFFYFPQIWTELFYDRQYDMTGTNRVLSSAGTELLLESRLLSLPVTLQGGIRFSWLIESAQPAWSLFIKSVSP